KHSPTSRRRCIEPLLVKVKPNPPGMKLPEEADEVLNAPPQAAHGPGRDQVELVPCHALEEPIKGRSLISPLGAADPVIHVGLVRGPAEAPADRSEGRDLVLGG